MPPGFENLERLREELRLQRKIGIKVKLEFDAPQWWTTDLIRFTEKIATPRQISAAKKDVKAGRVVELSVNPGVIEAKVQGSRKQPYSARIYSPVPEQGNIDALKGELAKRAKFGAMLLAGEMPLEFADIFTSCGVELTPGAGSRMRMLCGCPSPDSLCEHILAVVLVMTDAFDRDPFLLLKFRGVEKEDLLASLTEPRGVRRGRPPKSVASDANNVPQRSADYDAADDGAASGDPFFGGDHLRRVLDTITLKHSTGDSIQPPLDFPLWRGEMSFGDSMRPYYDSVRKLIKGR